MGGQDYAIALPNIIDDYKTLSKKWRKALFVERFFTERLKKIGLLVNPYCKIIDVRINKRDFPVIVMKKYSDFGFEVLDGKNPHTSNFNRSKAMLDQKNMTVENLVTFFEGCCKDIGILIQENINLGSKDALNLAYQNGNFRLFLNDLGYCKQQNEKFDTQVMTDLYIDWLLLTFGNILSDPEYYLFDTNFHYKSESLKKLKISLKDRILI